jgi:molecular chaperone DnaK (HSP70)
VYHVADEKDNDLTPSVIDLNQEVEEVGESNMKRSENNVENLIYSFKSLFGKQYLA